MSSTTPATQPANPREPNITELLSQLANAVNLRSSQDQVLWSIFGTFWAANAILLVALFPSGSAPRGIVGYIIAGVGCSFSLIWHLIQDRALGHLARHEALITRIERKLGFDPDYAVSGELNTKLYDQYLKKGVKARIVMKGSSIGGLIIWVGILVMIYTGWTYATA